jgi:preprotein translocase subunit SecE
MKSGSLAHLTRYLGEVRAELKKTTWPTRAEWVASTRIVLAAVLVVGLFVALVDLLLALLTKPLGF